MKTAQVPGPLGIALMTGRPELARYVGPDDVEAISDYAEQLVVSILQERENYRKLLDAIEMPLQNLRGAVSSVERLREAVRLMDAGASPEAIAAELENPNKKTKRSEE